MRRFITMMVWAMVLFTIGFSSSTAWAADPTQAYLYGEVNDKTNWEPTTEADMLKMYKIGTNEWEIKITESSTIKFKICIKFSDNGYSYYSCQSNTVIQPVVSGQGYNTWNKGNDSNAGMYFEGNLQNKYVQVKYNTGSNNPVSVTVSESSKITGTPTDAYLYGEVNGETNWSTDEADMLKMNNIGDNEWEIQIAKSGTSKFKVALNRGNGVYYYYTSNKPASDIYDEDVKVGNKYDASQITGSYDNKCFQGDLQNKYVHVKYDADSNSFSVKICNRAKNVAVENIWIFGSVGKETEWNKKLTEYMLSKTGTTEDGKPVYTGKVTFRNGDNWFHFWDGCLESATPAIADGPDNNKEISLNTAFNATSNTEKAFYYNNATDADMECDVKLIYNGSQNYSFTIVPSTLYLYTATDYNTPFATMTGDGNGNYIARKTTGNGFNKGDYYYLFVSKLAAGSNRLEWNSHDGNSYTTGTDVDAKRTITTTGSIDLSNTNSGSIKYSTDKEGTAIFTFTLNEGATGGTFDVAFAERPAVLYLYEATTLEQYLGMLEYDNGVYSVTYNNPEVDLGLNNTRKLFLTDKEKTTEQSMQDFKNRWTTTNKDGITLTNNNAFTAISKNTTGGAMNWTLTDKDATAVTMTADLQNGTFTITTTTSTEKYYLCGDINGWEEEKDNVASPNLNAYRFVPVKNADVKNEDGWYVLYVPRMHGQFKIHQGKWKDGEKEAPNWGCAWNRLKVVDTEGTKPYDNLTTDKEIYNYIDNSKIPECYTDTANLYGANIDNDNNVYYNPYYNVRCAHNYYKNAYIYFNPTANKLFIDGTPEDIFVYYYNGDDDAAENNEKKGENPIKIAAKSINPNDHHYYIDDRIFLEHNMPFVELSETDQNIPSLEGVVANSDKKRMCYKIQVSPGLEQPYSADGTKHAFEFYLSGAKKLKENDTQVLNGHSVYYIFSGQLPAVLLNYKDADGKEVTTGVEEMSYRLIAINANGEPEYITKQIQEDGTYRTKLRSKAAKYVLDYQIIKDETTGFKPIDKDGNALNGDNWFAVKKVDAGQSVMAKAAEWTSNVEPVKAGDVNRYVEFDVKLKDPESDSYYHEFTSDFVLSADNINDAFVQDNEIDTKAQMTGALLPSRDTNPQYKLNGTHLYAMAQTSVPTGIKDIENNEYDEEGEAETVYYNLQGVRVANPDRGIYIMVKGKTSKKVRF